MHKDLVVNRIDLNQEQDVWDYLYTLLEKYIELQEREPESIEDNFNNEQHALFAYMRLDSEVCNGGFIQLIYNGYGPFIFDSPFIDTLDEWGIKNTATLLKQVEEIYKEVEISQKEDDTVEDFSDLYDKYPQFDEFDNTYYGIMEDEVKLVRQYIETNLDKFILVQE